MQGVILIIAVAVIVEALIEYVKSVIKMFAEKNKKTAITQLVAIALAVLLCFATGADLFATLGVKFGLPWIGVALTGVFGSRGANYMSDLAKRLQMTVGK